MIDHTQRRPRARVLVTCAAIISTALTLGSGSRAATWIVPADAPTIQSAVGFASPGDTIRVEPGTYTGSGNRDIDFGGKPLVLRSRDGATATVLDCQGAGRGLVFQSGEGGGAVVEGFTIANGRADQGGAIRCSASSPTVVDCVMSGNRADQSGGAISCGFGAAPRIIRCAFEDNSSFLSGGAISCINASAEITECVISGNTAGILGGGIYCREASPTLSGCQVVNNVSGGAGAGLVFYHSSAPVVIACVVAGNRASGSAGGVFCDDNASPTFVDCLITGNYADFSGGAILCTARSSATIRGSTLSGNRAVERGGGLLAEAMSGFTVERTILWGNCAATDAQAHLSDSGSHVSFICCDVNSFGVGGPGSTSYLTDNIFADPLFCSPGDCALAPDSGGDYALEAGSPCRAETSPCEAQIGALGPGCGVSGILPEVTFGAAGPHLRVTPNPARGATTIECRLPKAAEVRIEVYDIAGRHIRKLFAGFLGEGTRSFAWDGRDDRARRVPSGIYVLKLDTRDESVSARVLQLR